MSSKTRALALPKPTLRHAALCVADLGRALQFYCEVLRFDPHHTSDPDWAMVSSEGTTLSLVRAKQTNPVSQAASRGAHPSHLGLVVADVGEVHALHTRLASHGGLDVGPVQKHRDGSHGFYFADPDGNQLEIIFIPYARQASDSVAGRAAQLTAGGERLGNHALVLIAHGSRDLRWREPLERLAAKVRMHAADQPVELAYMEFCDPTLGACTAKLYGQGVRSFQVVPVFLSSGAHVAEDIPRLVAECAERFPDAQFRVQAALGEAPGVLEALAAAVFSQVPSLPA